MRTFFVLMFLFFCSGFVFAQDSDIGPIIEPITRFYELIKGIVSVLGIIALTVAGAMYMLSGGNMQARENSKSMVTYAVIGLVLVWVAPLVVTYLTAP